MLCRGSVMDAVSTFKIVTVIIRLKTCYIQYDVSEFYFIL